MGRVATKVAALAVLFASITNAHAHVHLCFDGKKPPAAVHMGHSGQSHHSDNHGCQDDVDVDLRDDGVAKSFKPDLPVPTPAVFFVLPAVVDVDTPPIAEPSTARGPDPPRIRPPLRAPPLTLA